MSIADLLVGDHAVVVGVLGGNHQYRQRLFAAGIIPGVDFKLVQKAPFGDLVKVVIGNSCIALRAAEAVVVQVKKLADD